jgi:hypothetical protein
VSPGYGASPPTRIIEKIAVPFLMKENQLVPENAAGMKGGADDHVRSAGMILAIHAELRIDRVRAPQVYFADNLSAEPLIWFQTKPFQTRKELIPSTALAGLSIDDHRSMWIPKGSEILRLYAFRPLPEPFPRCDSTYSIRGSIVASARNREGRVSFSDT